MSLAACHPTEIPAHALQSGSGSRSLPWVPACRGDVMGDEEWGTVKPVTVQVSSFSRRLG